MKKRDGTNMTREDLFPERKEEGGESLSEKLAQHLTEEKKSRSKVVVYIMILFAVAFLLLLLSYLMNERDNKAAMTELTETHRSVTETAFQNIEELRAENKALADEVTANEGKISELQDEADRLEKENSSLNEKNGKLEEDQLYKYLPVTSENGMAPYKIYTELYGKYE